MRSMRSSFALPLSLFGSLLPEAPRVQAQQLVATPVLVEDADPREPITNPPAQKTEAAAMPEIPASQSLKDEAMRCSVHRLLPSDPNYDDLAATVLRTIYSRRSFRPLWEEASTTHESNRSLASEL